MGGADGDQGPAGEAGGVRGAAARQSARRPFHIGGIYEDGEVKYGIEIPYLLSILADHDPDGKVEGLDIVPPKDQPPINVTRLSFQTMVFIGTGLALLTAAFVLTWWRRRRLPRSKPGSTAP